MPTPRRRWPSARKALGAIAHHQIDARADYFEQVLRFLIMGNVRRGQLYPLCVGAERVMQAQTIARVARELGTNMIAHGCTAAGNDQVRFEVALRTLAPELEIFAPVRDHAFKRQEELEYLQQRKLPVPPYGAAYSINRGLWGVTIGGKETLTSKGSIPESAWVLSKDAFDKPGRAAASHHRLRARAVPCGLDGKTLDAGRGHRAAGNHRRDVRHRPRHPPGRHHHRHQGPRGLRGARRRDPAQRAPRAGEAGD